VPEGLRLAQKRRYCRGLYTVFVQLVILLWSSFIYEEISEQNVNKSVNRLYIYAPKVEKYHLQFISSLAGVKIKYTHYISSTYVFHLATKKDRSRAPFGVNSMNKTKGQRKISVKKANEAISSCALLNSFSTGLLIRIRIFLGEPAPDPHLE
jgi:hypothetical protein